jgi:hypothetical protein
MGYRYATAQYLLISGDQSEGCLGNNWNQVPFTSLTANNLDITLTQIPIAGHPEQSQYYFTIGTGFYLVKYNIVLAYQDRTVLRAIEGINILYQQTHGKIPDPMLASGQFVLNVGLGETKDLRFEINPNGSRGDKAYGDARELTGVDEIYANLLIEQKA